MIICLYFNRSSKPLLLMFNFPLQGYHIYNTMYWISLYLPGFKGSITVKWCNFLNLPDCSSCHIICLYPLCHYTQITDDYLSKCHCIINIIWKHWRSYRGIWSNILWYMILSILVSPSLNIIHAVKYEAKLSFIPSMLFYVCFICPVHHVSLYHSSFNLISFMFSFFSLLWVILHKPLYLSAPSHFLCLPLNCITVNKPAFHSEHVLLNVHNVGHRGQCSPLKTCSLFLLLLLLFLSSVLFTTFLSLFLCKYFSLFAYFSSLSCSVFSASLTFLLKRCLCGIFLIPVCSSGV